MSETSVTKTKETKKQVKRNPKMTAVEYALRRAANSDPWISNAVKNLRKKKEENETPSKSEN